MLKMLPRYYLAQFMGAAIALIYSELIHDLKIGALMPEDNDAVGCLRVVAS